VTGDAAVANEWLNMLLKNDHSKVLQKKDFTENLENVILPS